LRLTALPTIHPRWCSTVLVLVPQTLIVLGFNRSGAADIDRAGLQPIWCRRH
jgi:hypothetical protein